MNFTCVKRWCNWMNRIKRFIPLACYHSCAAQIQKPAHETSHQCQWLNNHRGWFLLALSACRDPASPDSLQQRSYFHHTSQQRGRLPLAASVQTWKVCSPDPLDLLEISRRGVQVLAGSALTGALQLAEQTDWSAFCQVLLEHQLQPQQASVPWSPSVLAHSDCGIERH